jgi:hypothetical protein
MAASIKRVLYAQGCPLFLAIPQACPMAVPLAQRAFLARTTGKNFGI